MDLVWRSESEALSESIVDGVDGVAKGSVGDLEEVAALGEILAQQAVGVFVEAALV